MADFQPTLRLIVPKEKIAANGDYNLSGERYRDRGSGTVCSVRRVTLEESAKSRLGHRHQPVQSLMTDAACWLIDIPGRDRFSESYSTPRVRSCEHQSSATIVVRKTGDCR